LGTATGNEISKQKTQGKKRGKRAVLIENEGCQKKPLNKWLMVKHEKNKVNAY